MHKVDGLSLKFLHRGSWLAEVYKGRNKIDTVPVAWANEVKFDPVNKKPIEFLVSLKTEEEAQEWAKRSNAIIAIARAKEPIQEPKSFKEFTRLFRVQPIGPGGNPLAVRAKFLELITAKSFPD